MKHAASHREQEVRAQGTVLPALRVCYVQAYRAPDYVRARTIRAALDQCDRVELTVAINTSPGLVRYWQCIRALLRVRRNSAPEVYILGFRGVEIAWLVGWLTRGTPLVLDALMSPHAALAEEGKHGHVGRWLARLWRPVEASALKHADAVLTDTRLHAAHYAGTFGIADQRLLALPVGADESVMHAFGPEVPTDDRKFRVLFYGSFLPLHGMDVIVEAAARLADLPIEFHFIGGTRRQERRFLKSCSSHNLRHYVHRRWVAFDDLVQKEIPRADLCLGGPFGGTPQARRVITGKTSQCLACSKATVVGWIDEDHGFVDRHNCLLVEQGDPLALAEAIRWAYENRGRLHDIGRRGQALYAERLSTRVAADALVPFLERLTGRVSRVAAA